MAEVLTVLTYKCVAHLISDGGTQSWVISPTRVRRRCNYVVCVRHQHGPYKAEGQEPHKHAFMVMKISGVVPSAETAGRFKVEASEYALIDGPLIPLNSASPTQYFPSLASIGIDEASLDWKPMKQSALVQPAPVAKPAEDNMSIIMQAKMLVAAGLHVPVSAVEIVVHG